ncbi:glutamate racemase [Marinobacter sp. NP-4(2019)]|uniref:glutamate racemase n=1 Tax=Marinobacter sp. NP-4(2019) TaxID=2488665 RepID=UPI000FC3F461|nr:glutamate racemase [Marinobacter sp. NP-4(2019)]AZT83103.1 glutamate racemase [Marinobacter sp. NP-4(2019)]
MNVPNKDGVTVPRILVFDSGVGGLSVSACIRQRLPFAEQVYVADNAGFPYGDQPESVVTRRCQRLISEALRMFPCDVIVVACNTASTVVLPDLRSMTSIPVVGVVPAVKPAAACSQNRRIGVLATPATIRRPYLEELIREFAADCQIERIGHPQLVRWIEDFVAGHELPQPLLCEALQPFRQAGVDTVVLGCTHYPLIRDRLQACLPDVRFWVDSGDAIARRTEWLLGQLGKSAVASRVVPDYSVRAALFSGEVPSGLRDYMEQSGLAPDEIRGRWPGDEGVTTAGSA